MNNIPAVMKRFVLFITAIAITLLPFKTGTTSQYDINKKIRVNILSKHLRLLKDGKTDELKFTLPPGTMIRYDDSEFYSHSLKIQYVSSFYRITADNRSMNFKKCFIYSQEQDSLFKITVDGEERLYPLPLEISRENELLKLYVTETPGQYAVDSAAAELGYIKPENSEALYALALAVHGRCRIDSLIKKHTDCHFCDLTCCQTYKGRSRLKLLVGPFIDTAHSHCGLFFHSSSGGRLFTESVFNSGGRKVKPPADVLYSENFLLSRNLHSSWSAAIDRDELSLIIFPEKKLRIHDIHYDPEYEIILITTDEGRTSAAPEDFRLKLNRKRGWNFIKSNNYSITEENQQFIFSGSGLGHCTGMSLEGAVQLAERGYSRYEILEHYYPDLKYLYHGKTEQSCQYVTYNMHNGNIIYSSTGASLLNRRIPCGSIFKLFTVIYLASERPDIFFNYTFQCSSENPSPLPEHCWEKKGHGTADIRSAIYNSCNIYFASLHDKISRKNFVKWFKKFTVSNKMTICLPEIKTETQWSELLAGLDFRTDISAKDLIKLSLFIQNPGSSITPEAAEIINAALRKTFTDGTAKISVKHSPGNNASVNIPADLWGKTGTVIAGTNSHHSYGIFIGGYKETGIVTILRKGKGADAAHLSASLLQRPELYFSEPR